MQLRKNLVMVIQRAQKATKITALGFTDLDFESFVQVFYLQFNTKYILYNNIFLLI